MSQVRQWVVVTHGYTDSNKGDVAIALGTVAALRQALPEAVITSHSIFSEDHVGFESHVRMMTRERIPVVEGVLPSPYLDDEGTGWGRDAAAMLRLAADLLRLGVLWFLPRLSWIDPRKARALGDIRRACLVVVRGGQYLHNESGAVRGIIFLTRMLLNVAVPIWLRRPTVVLGLSIGPLHGAAARRLLTATLRPCRAILVRESRSAEFLRSQGLGAKVGVIPDLAFLTTPARSAASRLPAGRWIGVTLINWSFPGNPRPDRAREMYLEAVLHALIEAYHSFELAPVVVQQVTVSHHGRHDRSLHSEMVERLRSHRVPAKEMTADLTPAELCDIFGQCQLVLASRLHTVILAACAGTPAVAIRYQGYKTQGILEMLSVPLPLYDIDGVTSGALADGIARVMEQRNGLSSQLGERVATLQAEIHSRVGEITALVQPPRVGAGS